MSGRGNDPWPLVAAAAVMILLLVGLGFFSGIDWFSRLNLNGFRGKGAHGTATPAAPAASARPPAHLSALAPEPVWADLQHQADTLTPDGFRAVMDRVYGDGTPAWNEWLAVPESGPPRLEVAEWEAQPVAARQVIGLRGTARPVRYWREAAELPPSPNPTGRPLDGVRIALDPGHIGGAWAKMEQRWYQPPNEPTAVMEGEMTLATARLLKPALEAMGATVSLVRDRTEPVTATRPTDYRADGRSEGEAELFFYRKAEIRSRADIVNQHLRPDLVVCLHFNAEPWGEPDKVEFVNANHLHLIVNGHYGAEELALDDVRFEMLLRLLQRTEEEELRLADAVARSLAAATGLPPYDYGRGHMAALAHRPLAGNPYVWARNLMANRLYQCPVIYAEPYVMNSREVYDRIAAGDYAGEKPVAGQARKSLFREYADAVAAGLRAHYQGHRPVR